MIIIIILFCYLQDLRAILTHVFQDQDLALPQRSTEPDQSTENEHGILPPVNLWNNNSLLTKYLKSCGFFSASSVPTKSNKFYSMLIKSQMCFKTYDDSN